MPDPRRQLAGVVYAANLDLDAAYAPLPAAVEALVLRHAERDGERLILTAAGAARAVAEVRALVRAVEAPVARAILARAAAAERLAEKQAAEAADG